MATDYLLQATDLPDGHSWGQHKKPNLMADIQQLNLTHHQRVIYSLHTGRDYAGRGGAF